MSKGAQERVEERAQRELLDLSLAEIRRNIAHLTQEQIAELRQTSEATLSALEKREDMLLSSLDEYVRALGGELELIARFPGRDVRITLFENIRGQIAEKRR